MDALLSLSHSLMQAGNGLNDALLRASADRAAQAILMTPLVSHEYEDEDHRLASKVMTGARWCVTLWFAVPCRACVQASRDTVS